MLPVQKRKKHFPNKEIGIQHTDILTQTLCRVKRRFGKNSEFLLDFSEKMLPSP